MHWHVYLATDPPRMFWTSEAWRFEARETANKAARRREPRSAYRMVITCRFGEACPVPSGEYGRLARGRS